MSSFTTQNAPERKRTEDAELLYEAMQRISVEQRAILQMKEVEGLGYEAISILLEIPVGTVGSRLSKARREVRATMIELGWEEWTMKPIADCDWFKDLFLGFIENEIAEAL